MAKYTDNNYARSMLSDDIYEDVFVFLLNNRYIRNQS